MSETSVVRSTKVIVRAEVADAKRQLTDLGTTTKKASAEFDKAGRTIETTSGKIVRSAQVNAQEWRTAGLALTTFGLASVAALAGSAKAAIDWQTAWTGVAKTVDGTDQELASLQGNLRAMARTLPASHQEIAGVAEAAGQLGVKVGDIAGFTKVMIDLGETTNLSAQDAATSLAQLMNIMQTAPNKVSNLGSAVVALGNNGASTESQIVEMAQRIAGAGKIVGMSEGDILGLANALASVGIDAEAGGSSVSKIMTDIAGEVSKGGAKLQGWAQLAGMTAKQFAQAWKTSPAQALTAVIEGLGRLNAAGGDVFGTLNALGQSDVRTERALLSLANAGNMAAQSVQMGNDAFQANNALLAEAEKRYATVASKIDVARNNVRDAGISMGQAFLPEIGKAAEGVAGLAGWLARLPEPLQHDAAMFGIAAGGASLLGGALLTMAPRIADTVKAFKTLQTVSPGVASGLTKSAKAIGAVTTSIALLAAAWSSAPDGINQGTNEILANIDKLGRGTKAADTVFTGIRDGNWFTGGVYRDFSKFVDAASDPSLGARIDSNLGRIGNGIAGIFGQDIRTGFTRQKDALKAYGDQLGQMASTDLPTVSAAFRELYTEAGGNESAGLNLLKLMPGLRDGLIGVANGAGLATDDATLLKVALGQVGPAAKGAAGGAGELAAAVEKAAKGWGVSVDQLQAYADHLDQWKQTAAQADASFLDPLGAYNALLDAATQKEQERAQKVADYTRSTKDTWQDYAKTATVSIDKVIKSMADQVAAQNAWEQNLQTLRSRGASEDLITYLMGQGQQGAPLVQALTTASDAQLRQFQDLYAQAGSDATGAFAEGLASKTVAPIDVWANTQQATSALDSMISKYNGTELDFLAVVKPKVDWSTTGPNLTTPDNSSLVRALPSTASAAGGYNPWQSGSGGSAAGLNPWQSSGAAAAVNGLNPWQGGGSTTVTVHESVIENTPIYVDHVTADSASDLAKQFNEARARATAGLRPVAW